MRLVCGKPIQRLQSPLWTGAPICYYVNKQEGCQQNPAQVPGASQQSDCVHRCARMLPVLEKEGETNQLAACCCCVSEARHCVKLLRGWDKFGPAYLWPSKGSFICPAEVTSQETVAIDGAMVVCLEVPACQAAELQLHHQLQAKHFINDKVHLNAANISQNGNCKHATSTS